MGDSSRERAACPLYTAIGVVAGRWKPMLFQRLSRRPHGFAELRHSMPDVSAKVLREQLRQMEADGLVVKRSLTPARLGVRYRVSPTGDRWSRSSSRCGNGDDGMSTAAMLAEVLWSPRLEPRT